VACGSHEALPQATPAETIPPSEPIVSWGIDPEVSTRYEYPVLGSSARRPIQLELEASTVSDAPESQISSPSGFALDGAGRMYIADGRQNRILIFEPDGSFSRTLGRAGPGPGEFQQLGPIAVMGGKLAAIDTRTRRIAAWDLVTGELVSDRPLWLPRQIWELSATAKGRLIGSYARADPDDPDDLYRHVVGITLTGFREIVYSSLPAWPRPRVRAPNQSAQMTNYYAVPVGTPASWYAVSPSDEVYITNGIEYVVIALDSDGKQRWVLSVPWPRSRVSEDEIEAAKQYMREVSAGWLTEVQLNQVNWPDLNPALSRNRVSTSNGAALRVDGLGFLYVFPHIPVPWATDERLRPVDVYASHGEALFGGTIPNANWQASHGDSILAVGLNADSQEWVASRYRIRWPGELQQLRDEARSRAQ
jgi:hypothetical protein